ncbi:MAG: threonine--tRNA ligase [Candidatus Nealsonbacteria bacterium]|nr:MAG: threonine--tRNA ligase [Candidatus Nealsonbacteria bacterium]
MAKIETIRHSLAHIMATAVQELFPGVKFGIGPVIENGFYYDFSFPKGALNTDDLPKIENKMKEIIKKKISFRKMKLSKQEINKIFKNQPYKLELMNELPKGKATFYESGDFTDLCKGPHVRTIKEINPDAFKLTKTAGAYWRGNEKRPMLTRIYGVGFKTKKELDNYLFNLREVEKRDHRLLGQKLELFSFDEDVGAGLPIWHPKGAILLKIIKDYLYQELTSAGYQWIISPHIGKIDLWKKSGHWDFYRENMYSPIKVEKEQYILKPVNCPFHIKVYQSKIRSYKNLPIKYAEFGTVYRYEKSGVLHGLMRVRGFTQDDAHIWCTSEQLFDETAKLLEHSLKIFRTFGFKEFDIYLSTRPKKYVGTEKGWRKATKALKYVLEKEKLKYCLDKGEGVFYGPKIDIKVKDSLGRPWQCTTIQVDFNLTERFNITYINKKGRKQRPYIIHRALLGSLERFLGVLLENYAGNLPLWLAPEQMWVISVGSKNKKYAKEVGKKLRENNFRCEVKDENETLSKKIRNGELQKIPYLLVVGDKEMKTRAVRPRHNGKDLGQIKLTKFIKKAKIEVEKKR